MLYNNLSSCSLASFYRSLFRSSREGVHTILDAFTSYTRHVLRFNKVLLYS